jgi:hypothetical protein
MRSQLVFGALAHVPNRFLLTRIAAKATRKFHRPSTRIQETMDEVFARFAETNPLAPARETNHGLTLSSARNTETKLRYNQEDRAVA